MTDPKIALLGLLEENWALDFEPKFSTDWYEAGERLPQVVVSQILTRPRYLGFSEDHPAAGRRFDGVYAVDVWSKGDQEARWRMLRESTGAASAAQAVLATLTGRWWLIPLALAAGAVVYSKIRSMQAGGPVRETGLYVLHRGEYVVPARHLHSYGPIFVSFQRQPREGMDTDEFLRDLGPRLVESLRRGG